MYDPWMKQEVGAGAFAAQAGRDLIMNGYPPHLHERLLKERETQVRQELKELYEVKLELSGTKVALLQKELENIYEQRANLSQSYQKRILFLEETVQALQALGGGVDEQQLLDALTALDQGDTEQADALFEQVVRAAESGIIKAARASYERGKINRAKWDLIHANEHFERAAQLEPSNPEYLYTAAELAYDLGKLDQAISWLQKAESLLMRPDVEYRIALGQVQLHLGEAWLAKGQAGKAIEYCEQGLQSTTALFGDGHECLAPFLNGLGRAWQIGGDLDKAMGLIEQALSIALTAHGESHPEVARYRNNLGHIWEEKGDPDRAITYYEYALASDLKIFGVVHPRVAVRQNNLCTAWIKKGDSDKAMSYIEPALASAREVYGERHSIVAARLNNLALALSGKGELDRAIENYNLALEIDLENHGEDFPHVSTVRFNLGKAWSKKGDLDKAIGYFEQALKGELKIRKEGHRHLYDARRALAETWLAKRDLDKAIMYYELMLEGELKAHAEDHPRVNQAREVLELALRLRAHLNTTSRPQ